MDINHLTFAKAIADEKRQVIMMHLCCVWLSVSEIVDLLDGKINQPTVSHHLKILEEANLVLMRKEGKHRYYTLNQDHLTFCCGALMQTFAPNYAAKIVPIDSISTDAAR